MQSYGLTNNIDQHGSRCYDSTFLKIYCVAGPNSQFTIKKTETETETEMPPKILINKLF